MLEPIVTETERIMYTTKSDDYEYKRPAMVTKYVARKLYTSARRKVQKRVSLRSGSYVVQYNFYDMNS